MSGSSLILSIFSQSTADFLSSTHSIDDFLAEEIRGPATFSCETGRGCQFKEPAMNELISDIFGDPFITLECDSGECMHPTMVPGYVVRPLFLFSSLFLFRSPN